jgi:hypothetical protein
MEVNGHGAVSIDIDAQAGAAVMSFGFPSCDALVSPSISIRTTGILGGF